MANGQRHGNREARKPKKKSEVAVAVATPLKAVLIATPKKKTR